MGHLQMMVRGREGGTWAHWQLATDSVLSTYLSPAFHKRANEVIRDRFEEQVDSAEHP